MRKREKKKKNRNAGRAGGEGAFYNSVALIAASETVQKKGWGRLNTWLFRTIINHTPYIGQK